MNDKVEIGQVWESMDPREHGRRVKIIQIVGDFAMTQNVETDKLGHISLKSFKPNSRGWRLLTNAELL